MTLAFVAVGAHGAPAAAQERAREPSVVGEWNAVVYLDDGTIERDARLSFTSDGDLVTQGAVGQGNGAWEREGPQRFSYSTLTEADFGNLVVSARVVVLGDVFVGVGEAAVYDAEGNVLGTGHSIIIAVRDVPSRRAGVDRSETTSHVGVGRVRGSEDA